MREPFRNFYLGGTCLIISENIDFYYNSSMFNRAARVCSFGMIAEPEFFFFILISTRSSSFRHKSNVAINLNIFTRLKRSVQFVGVSADLNSTNFHNRSSLNSLLSCLSTPHKPNIQKEDGGPKQICARLESTLANNSETLFTEFSNGLQQDSVNNTIEDTLKYLVQCNCALCCFN